jgi:hypothetical protein
MAWLNCNIQIAFIYQFRVQMLWSPLNNCLSSGQGCSKPYIWPQHWILSLLGSPSCISLSLYLLAQLFLIDSTIKVLRIWFATSQRFSCLTTLSVPCLPIHGQLVPTFTSNKGLQSTQLLVPVSPDPVLSPVSQAWQSWRLEADRHLNTSFQKCSGQYKIQPGNSFITFSPSCIFWVSRSDN